MSARLLHKGRHVSTCSPGRNVHIGEIGHWPKPEGEEHFVASCANLELDWSQTEGPTCRDNESRNQIRRQHLQEVLCADPMAAPSELEGMYSFAYWDNKNSRLVIAVDRIGYEQIYFARTARRFVFASNYKALLALSDVNISVNKAAMQFTIATLSPDLDSSLASGISRLPRSHVMTADSQTERCRQYWRARIKSRRISASAASAELSQTLTSQIRETFNPYDRVAITLSGGLDSAGLLALIKHVYPALTIATYTIGHSVDDPEITGARQVSEAFDTEHHEMFFDPVTIRSDLPKMVWLAEELAGREEILLQYQVERCLQGHEDVVVTGHGADRAFAGMPRHRLLRMSESIPFARRPLMELFQQTQSGLEPESLRGRLASQMLYGGNHLPPPRVSGAGPASIVDEPASLDAYLESSIVGMHSILYHAAIHSTAPIEPLMPYLGLPVHNCALSLPAHRKTSLLRQKIVLRDALDSILPDTFRKRGKAIQRVKRNTAMTEVLDAMADELLNSASLRNRGLIDEAYVTSLRSLDDGDVYAGDRFSRLWMLLISEIWCRTFIDNRGLEIT